VAFLFAAANVRQAAFLRIGTAPVARAWTGFGRFYLPADAVESDPTTPYLGIGWMQGLPPFRSVRDDQADRLTFTLSGVDQRTQDLVEADDVAGATFDLGYLALDRRRKPLGPVLWRLSGRVESTGGKTMQVGQSATGVTTHTRTVTLAIIVGDGARRTSSMGMWTPADLGRLAPTDRFYDRVPAYTPDATRAWPPK
jgi:hypothetical protein